MMTPVPAKSRIEAYQQAQDWIDGQEHECRASGYAPFEEIETSVGTIGFFYWGKRKIKRLCHKDKELPLTNLKGEEKVDAVEAVKAKLKELGL
jgi:hypothetical protein